MSEALPIRRLITQEAGLSVHELARRLGYRDAARGMRKLEAFLDGDFDNPFIRERLAEAMGRPEDEIEEALAESRKVLEARREAARAEEERRWRAEFKPHGLILTDRDHPRPIFMWAFGYHPEHVDLEGVPEARHVETMLAAIAERRYPDGRLPLWGRITGFAINRTPDHAVLYDPQGRQLETRDRAVRLGEGYMALG